MARKQQESVDQVTEFQVMEIPLVTIESAQAFFNDLVKSQKIQLPKDISVGYVCEDGNVFFLENPARVWVEEVKAKQDGKNLQLFEVKCH